VARGGRSRSRTGRCKLRMRCRTIGSVHVDSSRPVSSLPAAMSCSQCVSTEKAPSRGFREAFFWCTITANVAQSLLADSPSASSLVRRLRDHANSLRNRGNHTQQSRCLLAGPQKRGSVFNPAVVLSGGPLLEPHRATWSHVLCMRTFLCCLIYAPSPISSSVCFRRKYGTVRLHTTFRYCTITDKIHQHLG
jgi:hypothetical protein